MNQPKNCFQFWIETIEYMVYREIEGLPCNEGYYWEEVKVSTDV